MMSLNSDGEITASDAAQIMQKVIVETHKTPIESKSGETKYLDVITDGITAADDASAVLQKKLVIPCETKSLFKILQNPP
ncbi:MAG: hypothetical protein IJ583_08320 [Firmicutes bacterium]|nr:hypothetical protein [Bacillota bacterium]